MTKAKKTEENTKKEIKFEMEKDDFKKVIKSQVKAIYYEFNHVLSSVNARVKNGVLILASTDGNRLLKTEIKISDDDVNFPETNYNGIHLNYLKINKAIGFPKGCLDPLEITLTSEKMIIKDKLNNVIYNIPVVRGQYPKYEHLIKIKKNLQMFGFNVQFLKDLENLQVNRRTNIVKVHFDKKNNLKPIVVTADDGEKIKSTTLIMPVQMR